MTEEPSPKRVKIAATTAGEFRVDANEVINFRLLETNKGKLLDDINSRGVVFPPEMCHRIFGDAEEIQGYVGLTIDIWMSARTYHTWLDINFGSKRAICDDLPDKFKTSYPGGFSLDKASFVETVKAARAPDVYNLGTTISSSELGDGSELRIQLHDLASADAGIKVRGRRSAGV
jgi:hypothetical protein